MNRRSFLSTILAAACAPAIVRADSLMRIVPRDLGLYGYTASSDAVTEAGLAYGPADLSLVVGDLLRRSGLDPSMYDVSALAGDNVRGLVIDSGAEFSTVVDTMRSAFLFDLSSDANGIIVASKRVPYPN